MKTKDLRKKLIDVIDQIQAGELSASDGRNIVGAANQINISLQTELKNMKLQYELGRKVNTLGNMDIS